MEGSGLRQSTTLSELMTAVESSKLREFLNVKDEDEKRGGRTLLDIMRDEQEAVEVTVGPNSSNGAFKNRLRLRLRRSINAWAAAVSTQTNLISNPEIVISVRPAAGEVTAADVAATSHSEERQTGDQATTGGQESADLGPVAEPLAPAASGATAEHPMRVSLMLLLEQTDRQWSSGGESTSPAAVAALASFAEEETSAEDVGGGGGGGGTLQVCCVCMLRHKGAAFIPCGHTFCRQCSRELWESRGCCPLCNSCILEVLDIF